MTAAAVAAQHLITPGNVVVAVGIIGFLIAAAAVVGASFRNANIATTLQRYRDDADSWERTSRRQEAEITELQESGHLKDAKIAVLEGKVETLTEMVTGRAAIEALGTRVSELLGQAGEIRAEIRLLRQALVPEDQP